MNNATVKIIEGSYRNEPVRGQIFPLIKPLQDGSKGPFVTVDGSAVFGPDKKTIRIRVANHDAVEYTGYTDPEQEPEITETVEEAKMRIRKRFQILDQMTDAVARGTVRGLVVSGPPGVGKSFGVEHVIDGYEMQHRLSGEIGNLTETVKGSMSPIGLYKTLYENSRRGNVLVFDDSDSILFDEVCLNMLKAVLDTGKKRMISWKSESRVLKEEGIPSSFEFCGGVIFITNLDFENVRSKKISDHLAAVMSRCHYIDLEMNANRDRFIRIDQIIEDGMLEDYGFGEDGNQEIVEFMTENQHTLREISLRMVIKLADLKKMDNENWQDLARNTCLRRAG